MVFLLAKMSQLLDIDPVGNEFQFLGIGSPFQLIRLVDSGDRNDGIGSIITDLLHEAVYIEPPFLEETHALLVNAIMRSWLIHPGRLYNLNLAFAGIDAVLRQEKGASSSYLR